MAKLAGPEVLRALNEALTTKEVARSLAAFFPPSTDSDPVHLARSGLERATTILRDGLGRDEADLATPAEAARLLSALVNRLRQSEADRLDNASLIEQWVAELQDRRPRAFVCPLMWNHANYSESAEPFQLMDGPVIAVHSDVGSNWTPEWTEQEFAAQSAFLPCWIERVDGWPVAPDLALTLISKAPEDLDPLNAKRMVQKGDISVRRDWISRLVASESEDARAIRSACRAYARAAVEQDAGELITRCVICLENLLTPDRGERVEARLTEAVAFTLASSRTKRKEIRDLMKQLYAQRSRWVHAGKLEEDKKKVWTDIDALVREALSLVRDIISEEIKGLPPNRSEASEQQTSPKSS
jgi:hypothetical protein